jgi:hypothetical protein
MADDKKTMDPLEQLQKEHAEASRKRKASIVAATKDLRAAEEMVREIRAKIGGFQQENITASFAYDARRAELEAKPRPKAA